MLSPRAIESDKALNVPLLRLGEIFADPEFNCRGNFTAADILELTKDVAERGLIQPVTVRPIWLPQEKELSARGIKYSLIAGFRRYASYRANGAEVIPAVIRNATSEFECRDINAVENLQRLDLTLWQECVAIKHYWLANWTRQEVADRISKSSGWVQLRYMLLEMPEEIQQAAHQGYILISDVRELHKYKSNKEEMLKMAGIIRDKRKNGEGKNMIQHIRKRDKATTKKIRQRDEIFTVMDYLREHFKQAYPHQSLEVKDIVSPQGNNLAIKCLAWAAGEIDNLTFHTYVREYCDAIGVGYTFPDFEPETF